MQLHAVPRGLRAVAAGGHIAPAAATVPCFVLEYAPTSRISTASHARELSEYECVAGTLHHGDEQAGEGITHRHERSREGSVTLTLEAAGAGAAAQHAIDLGERFSASLVECDAALGEGAEDGAHPPRIGEDSEGARGLLVRASAHGGCALSVEQACPLEPANEVLEIDQRVVSLRDGVRVHEVEPQALRDERERVSFTRVGG